jgi:hypothetical protein
MPTEVLSRTENSLLALCYNANDVKEFWLGAGVAAIVEI